MKSPNPRPRRGNPVEPPRQNDAPAPPVRTSPRNLVILGIICALVVGFYAWNAGPGFLESWAASPKDNYYNLLARSLRDGHVNLEREVPANIAPNGDIPGQDWVAEAVSGLAELSYYKGKLYLYFGITPALTLFAPFTLLTGQYLTHRAAVVIFMSVGFLTSAALLFSIWRRYFRETSVWTVAAGLLALGLANFAPPILRRSDVYEVAVSCGYAMVMLALAGIWRALHDPPRAWRWLAAASLAYGLALGARPSLLFGAVILLIPLAQAWREKRPLQRLFLSATLPIFLIGLGLMYYNWLRFGKVSDFGTAHQLPPVSLQYFNPRYFWFNFRVSFLEPAKWESSFPYADDINVPPHPYLYFGEDHPFGVLTNIPLVWLALLAPLAWWRSAKQTRAPLGFFGRAGLLFAASALTLCFYTYMAMRYELEFTDALIFLSVLGFFALERALSSRPLWLNWTRGASLLLLAFSAAFNVLGGLRPGSLPDLRFGSGFAIQGQARRSDRAVSDGGAAEARLLVRALQFSQRVYAKGPAGPSGGPLARRGEFAAGQWAGARHVCERAAGDGPGGGSACPSHGSRPVEPHLS